MDLMPSAMSDINDVGLLQQVFLLWNSNNQSGALDLLRPRAESNLPWAAALMAWLLVQQGFPGHPESVNWAIKAAQLGAPWQAVQTFNNVAGSISANPQLADRLPELLTWALPWMGGVDVVGQGWNLLAQGQPDLALRVMMTSTPWPLSEPQLAALGEQGRARIREMDDLVTAARLAHAAFDGQLTEASETISKTTDDLTTSAKQADLLVTTVLSDATNALYLADATRNEKESRGVWRWGLAILALAALAAVLPVGLHYLDAGLHVIDTDLTYSTAELIGVHLASTAALGTFAGVLLARARSRDRAAQRSYDLSTAMGTMISYSNRISDPVEKERFMTTMGQVVMQAHLGSDSGSGSPSKPAEDPVPGLLALANALRATNSST